MQTSSEVKSPSVSSAERLPWVDYAKGLSILFIVATHTTRGLQRADIIPRNSGIVEVIGTFASGMGLPLFFYIAGMFVTGLVRRPTPTFIADRFQKVAYPYVLWVTLFCLAQLAMTGYTNFEGSLSEITGMLHSPPGHYWFIYATFIISIAYVSFRKTGVTAAALLLMSFAAYLAYVFDYTSPWSPVRYIQIYSVFFALGALIGRKGLVLALARAPGRYLLPLTMFTLTLVAIVGWFNVDKMPWIRLPVGLCSITGGLSIAILLERHRLVPFVESWGFRSLEIYLAHVHGTAGMRILLLKVFGLSGIAVHVSLGMIAGLYLPILVLRVSRRLGFPYLFSLKPRKIPETHVRPATSPSRHPGTTPDVLPERS